MSKTSPSELYSVFVGHLEPTVTKAEIKEVFSQVGEIKDLFICDSQRDGSYLFGFVRYGKLDYALKAVEDLHKWPLRNTRMIVDLARETVMKIEKEKRGEDTVVRNNMKKVKRKSAESSSSVRSNVKSTDFLQDVMYLSRVKEACISLGLQAKLSFSSDTCNQKIGTPLELSTVLDDIYRSNKVKAKPLDGFIQEEGGPESVCKSLLNSDDSNPDYGLKLCQEFGQALCNTMSSISTFLRKQGYSPDTFSDGLSEKFIQDVSCKVELKYPGMHSTVNNEECDQHVLKYSGMQSTVNKRECDQHVLKYPGMHSTVNNEECDQHALKYSEMQSTVNNEECDQHVLNVQINCRSDDEIKTDVNSLFQRVGNSVKAYSRENSLEDAECCVKYQGESSSDKELSDDSGNSSSSCTARDLKKYYKNLIANDISELKQTEGSVSIHSKRQDDSHTVSLTEDHTGYHQISHVCSGPEITGNSCDSTEECEPLNHPSKPHQPATKELNKSKHEENEQLFKKLFFQNVASLETKSDGELKFDTPTSLDNKTKEVFKHISQDQTQTFVNRNTKYQHSVEESDCQKSSQELSFLNDKANPRENPLKKAYIGRGIAFAPSIKSRLLCNSFSGRGRGFLSPP